MDLKAYQSVDGFTIVKATSSSIIGWVPNEDILDEVLEVHSIETLSQFVSWHDDKTRPKAGRIFWTHKDVPEVTYPFTLDRHIIRQCSYGKAHKRENKIKKVIDVHDYAGLRKAIQPTRKVDCEAKIIIRYITIFPQFSCSGPKANDRERRKLSEALKEDQLGRLEESRIYIILPQKDQHSNHEVTKESAFSKRLHKTIIAKIHDLVTSGITNIPLIKKSLKIFVETEFSKEEVRPSPFDRAYYPLSKDIKNHVQRALFVNRLGGLDQVNLQKKIEEWKKEDGERLFLYRPATISGDKEEKFLFVHQENWQRKILSLYGNTISLLDATYKTTKYALPFFMLVVKTNVDYLPVAQFVVEDEVSSTIEEALSVIKNWNSSWNPAYFMVDYCEAEINAIESAFPTTNVLQCAFHREQAWERKSKGEYKFIRDDFLDKMRQLAYSATEEDYQLALEDLTSNNWYTDNKQLQSYVKNRWLNIKERWCRAFQDLGFHSMVTTTNGVETLNKTLKHSYLKLSGTGSLCNLFEIIIKDFLHDLFHTYAMLNFRSSCNFKAYDSQIPSFLHNRPRHVVDHCMRRMSSSEMFSLEDFCINEEGVFIIKSQDRIYHVNLGTDDTYPFCDCEDFKKNYLPCKHFFAVFRLGNKEWNNLSPLYRESMYLSIDQNVLELYSRPAEYKDETSLNTDDTSQSSPSQPPKDLRYHQQELLSEIKSMQNMVYEVEDTEVLTRSKEKIDEAKEILRNGIRIEDGLPVRSEQLRTLPKKRKAFASQWSKRVGRKASTLKKNICTGLPNYELKNTDTEVKESPKGRVRKKHSTEDRKAVERKENVSELDDIDIRASQINDCKKHSVVEQDRITASKLVNQLWNLPKNYDVPVAKVFGTIVTDTDIRSLRQTEWLTDQNWSSCLTSPDRKKNVKEMPKSGDVHNRILDTAIQCLESKEFSEDGCDMFLHVISTLNWDVIWDLIVDCFSKLQKKLPTHPRDAPVFKKTWSKSLGQYGDGFIDFIPMDFKKRQIYPVDLEECGTLSLFRSVSVLLFGNENRHHLIRLQTICHEILHEGKACQITEKEILYKTMRYYSEDICSKYEDEIATYHLKSLPEALNVSINLWKHDKNSVEQYGSHGLKCHLFSVYKAGNICLSFLPFIEGKYIDDRLAFDRYVCGALKFCQDERADDGDHCIHCLQYYHRCCLYTFSEESKHTPFECGCHVKQPYVPKDKTMYTDLEKFHGCLKTLDIKKIFHSVFNDLMPSMRWDVFCGIQCKAKQNMRMFNLLSFKGCSEEAYKLLVEEIELQIGNDTTFDKIQDVFLPEVMVNFVMKEEGVTRLFAERFLQENANCLQISEDN